MRSTIRHRPIDRAFRGPVAVRELLGRGFSIAEVPGGIVLRCRSCSVSEGDAYDAARHAAFREGQGFCPEPYGRFSKAAG
jgi:hypothetical protein